MVVRMSDVRKTSRFFGPARNNYYTKGKFGVLKFVLPKLSLPVYYLSTSPNSTCILVRKMSLVKKQ